MSHIDVLYRGEAERNPYSSEIWLRWVLHKEENNETDVFELFDKAVDLIPRSYKVWKNYLIRWEDKLENVRIDDSQYDIVNNLYEKSLLGLFKMPRLWINYGKFLLKQKKISKAREVLDRALRILPIMQHTRIWEIYIDLLKLIGSKLPHLSTNIWSRYLQLKPLHREIYVSFLKSINKWESVVENIFSMVNDEAFVSSEGKTRHEIWLELCEIISCHANDLQNLDVEKIMRSGIKQFHDDGGRLWNWLANFYIRSGSIEKARDVYEEALASVRTVRDFALVFDSYTEMQKQLIIELEKNNSSERIIDYHISQLEELIERRPEMLGLVKLRQNPNNIYEWLNRTKMLRAMAENASTKRNQKILDRKVLETYAEATLTVDSRKCLGIYSNLWISFAGFYERKLDTDSALEVIERGIESSIYKMDDLAALWCEKCEYFLRRGQSTMAISTIREVMQRPKTVYPETPNHIANQLWRSQRLWALYFDLEECYGNVDTLKVCLHHALDYKIVTVKRIINCAQAFEDKNYFEKSFQVYEDGIQVFKWPQLYCIWMIYLSKFCSRYGASKLERARELFERAISDCPPKYARRLFIMYMNMEEEYGLNRHTLDIIARSIDKVLPEEKWIVYRILINKTTKLFGLLKTRPIFEKAIEELDDMEEKREACLLYSTVERGLGEIRRARAILAHGSQYADKDSDYWGKWREFEVLYGDENTFRDMLRMKTGFEGIAV